MTSYNKILLSILLVSIFTVLLCEVFLADTYEIFEYGHEFGSVLSNLSLAYISSYIFYILIVVTKEKHDKRNIYNLVNKWSENLIGASYSVFTHIYNEVNNAATTKFTYDKKTISRQEFTGLCLLLNPTAIYTRGFLGGISNPRPGTHAEWIYYYSITLAEQYINKIFNYMPFLDSEHIRLINKLHSSTYAITAHSFAVPTLSNTDFSVWANDMYDYLLLIRELDDYIENISKKKYR